MRGVFKNLCIQDPRHNAMAFLFTCILVVKVNKKNYNNNKKKLFCDCPRVTTTFSKQKNGTCQAKTVNRLILYIENLKKNINIIFAKNSKNAVP